MLITSLILAMGCLVLCGVAARRIHSENGFWVWMGPAWVLLAVGVVLAWLS